jgi:hypothetical protein
MNEEEQKNVTISKRPTRFGWKDFILNLIFSLVMIVSIYFFVIRESPEDLVILATSIVVTVLPLLLFSVRVFNELSYSRDYIEIVDNEIKYRSTPLLTTGLRVKKGEITPREIRKFGLSKIPRKLSLDLWKQKKKAMLVISLKSGKEHFIGEYIDNDDLAEICVHIQNIYPKAKLITNLSEEYPELAKKQTKLATAKKSKKLEDEEDDEPEGAGYRRRR